jgi:hypothetical protein
VIEIELAVDKWGGARNDMFTLPWAAFRVTTLPVQVLSNRDGSYRVANKEFQSVEGRPRLLERRTGGWLAFVSGESASDRGIGIVFGRDPLPLDGPRGYVQWGTYGSPKRPELQGAVAEIERDVHLSAGESLHYRYYLVIGTLAEIQQKGNALQSGVKLERIVRTPADATAMPICRDGQKGLKRTCPAGESPAFKTYREFVANSRPLFLLQDAGTGQYMVTDNPYEISFDPTDGATRYVDLLGWALPTSKATDGCGLVPLGTAIASAKPRPRLGRSASDLRVLSASEGKCPSIGERPTATGARSSLTP